MRNPVINLEVQKNGRKVYTTFYEGINEMAETNTDEFGMELLLNLGNFSNLKIITKRHGSDSQVAGDQIIQDLLALKTNFLKKQEELLS